MRKYLILIILSLFNLSLHAQVKKSENYSLGISTGYTYANSHFIQLGTIYGANYGNVHIPSKGFGLGVDIGKVNNKLTIGTKAFYEYNFFIASGFRLNAINYFSGEKIDFRLMPQVGLSIMGNINFMYGYSIPTLGNELTDISRNSFSVTINLFKQKK